MFQVRPYNLEMDNKYSNPYIYIVAQQMSKYAIDWLVCKTCKLPKNHGNPCNSATITTYRGFPMTFLTILYTALLVMTASHSAPILAHPIALECMRVGRVPPSRAIEAPEEIDSRQATAKLFSNAYDRMRVVTGSIPPSLNYRMHSQRDK